MRKFGIALGRALYNGGDMSDYAERTSVPSFADGRVEGGTRAEVGSPTVRQGTDWPVIIVLFSGIAAGYAVAIGTVYVALMALV